MPQPPDHPSHSASRRRAASMLAASVAVPALSLSLGACQGPPPVLRVGLAQPLSGRLAAYGQDMVNGAELAVEALRARGSAFAAQRLELVRADDQALGPTNAARALIDAGVQVVIGHWTSEASLESAPHYAAAGVAQLSTATQVQLTQAPGHALRLVADSGLQARTMGEFAARRLLANRFAVLDDGTLSARELADGAAQELRTAGKTLVLRASPGDEIDDAAALARAVCNGRVDAIVCLLRDGATLRLLSALKALRYTSPRVLGGDNLRTPLVLSGGELMDRPLHAVSCLLDLQDFPNASRFANDYRSAFRNPPSLAAHYAHDAVHLIAQARAAAADGSAGALAKSLRQIDGQVPVVGHLSFDARGEQRYGAVGVYALHDGGWDSVAAPSRR